MTFVGRMTMLAAFSAALLAAPGAAFAQSDTAVGVGAVWPRPGYGPYGPYPYGPYPYGGYGPWGPCLYGPCADNMELRRAVRRELQLQELRRELEQGSGYGPSSSGGGGFGVRRDPPPPTPESEMQPRFRGSGEVRPEYRSAGQAR
jgi:hypothetical protein